MKGLRRVILGKKQNTGSMCKEKWGEPLCNEWKPVQKIEKIKESKMIPLAWIST